MSLFYVCAPFILTTEPEIEGKQLHDSVYKYSLREGYYSSAQHVHIFQLCVNKCLEVIFFLPLSLILFSQILHLRPTLSRPRRLASTLAVAVCAAARQCALWSTLGPWFLSSLASWEWTEPSAGTTMSLEIWWGPNPPACTHAADILWQAKRKSGCCRRRWHGVELSSKGSVILDPDFDVLQEMGHLCKICKAISANKQLVKPGGAQCLPSGNSPTKD